MTKYKLTMTWNCGTDEPIDPQFCALGRNEYPEGCELAYILPKFLANIATETGNDPDGFQLHDDADGGQFARIAGGTGIYADYRLEEIEAARQSCDQCEAMMTNGVYCHETGCPNEGSRWSAEESRWIRQRECIECGNMVDEDEMCCDDEREVLDYLHFAGLDFDDMDMDIEMLVGA